MPFKSEKQRKYLWANEPEIARDWTETYGSKIKKADGGIMKNIKGHDHMLAYITPGEAKSLEDMGGQKTMTPEGIPAYPPQGQSAQHGGKESSTTSSSGSTSGGGGHHSGGDHRRPTTYSKPKTKPTPPKGGYGQSNKNLDRGWGTTLDNFTKNQIDSFVRRNKAKNINQAIHGFNFKTPLAAILSGLNTDDETDSYDVDSIREIASRFGGNLDTGQVAGLAGLRRDFEFEDKFTDPTTKDMRDFYNLDPPPTTGGEGQPYIYPPYGMASAPGETESPGSSDLDDYLAGLGGDYLVPLDYVQNRTRAAYGGIMDTYTGRRKYGLGSVFKKIASIPKKAVKAVKKIASSPIGKLAMMYAAGTYLGGTQAMGGSGQLSFAQRLKDPKLLGNLVKPQGWSWPGSTDTGTNLLTKGLGWIKENPYPAILGGSALTGLMTAKMPVEELDDADAEYDAEKLAFDEYLASLGVDNYRVPTQYRLAEGGRIGAEEGGLMDLGGLEKDYRETGGFVEIGGREKADDVPARLSRNEFVMTADAVRGAGNGDIDKGAAIMEDTMKTLETKGKKGAQDMFAVSERLSEVV